METFIVVDNPAASQFEARTDAGAVVGIIAYDTGAAGPDVVVVTHTEVPQEYEGQGVGGRLARGALDLIRASGRQVVPLCTFVSAYISRHEEYENLVHLAPDSGQGG